MAKETNPKNAGITEVAIPAERGKFNELILGNPNYFGTYPKYGGKVVKAQSGDTSYEELTCLGLNPYGSSGNGLLEAVVNIKQHYGYGTDACGSGTTEYVRFFVHDGTGWHDLGASSVQVYDLTGPLPLSYPVSVNFSESRKYCSTENIVHVRAILSWEWMPTPGDPNFVPVWGNVVNAHVQVAPLLLYEVPIANLVAAKEITLAADLLPNLDLTQPLPAVPPKPLGYSDLKALYANSKVPAHRFGFSAATKIAQGAISAALPPVPAAAPGTAVVAAAPSASLLAGAELGAILAEIDETSGDTTYEELTCAGYNPQTQALEGVLQVRQSSGYSGDLCTAGSTEYVSFYAYFGGVWNALGTAQVQVHDLKAASPSHPISYAVFRFSNLTSAPCEGLQGVPLRAILSWSTPPTGPDFVPVWGNVLNTHVQPQIAAGEGEDMRLMRIGRVTVANIDNATGLAVVDPVYVPPSPPGLGYVTGDCPDLTSPWVAFAVEPDSPFGGETIVEGDFNPKIDVFDHTTGMVLPGEYPIIYQAWVTPPSGPAFQLTNSFGIELYPPAALGGVFFTQNVVPALGPVPSGPPGTLYYNYMESDLQAVNPRTLAVFEADGYAEGNYTIVIQGYKWDGTNYLPIPRQSKMIHVFNGYPHLELTVGGSMVEEYRPQVSLAITSPSGDCGDVQVGDTVNGTFSVTDEFFGMVSVALAPIVVGGIPQPENAVVLSTANYGTSEVLYDGTNTTGTSGTFTLSTAGMTPCGYTILLGAWDRALVSGSCSGHYNETGVGFCLRAAASS